MDPTRSTGTATYDDEVPPRPAGQLTVRFEPAADALEAGTAADSDGAQPGVDEFLAPGLEEAGYGYGV